MAALQEPEFLSLFAQHKVNETLRDHTVRRALEDRDAVGADGGEILRQRERHVAPAGDGDLRERVKVDRERVSGFTQRHVLGGRGGDAVNFPGVAGNLRQQLPAAVPAAGLQKRFEHIDHRSAVARIADSHPAVEFRSRQLLPTRDERQLHPLLHEPVLQNAEARQRRAIPGVTGVVDFDAVKALRNAGQDFLRRLVRQRELFVGQQQKRFGAAAEKNVDADAIRLGDKLGLHEPERVRRAAGVAPFDDGAVTEPFAVPLVEASSEFVANGLVVR